MIPRHKINKIKVEVIPKDIIPLEFIKGSELFEDPYANIYILAKKNSGKTTVEFNIIKKCTNKHTTVIFFAGQLYKDASYKHIINWLKKHNTPYVLNNSITSEEGTNQLKELLDHLKNEYKDELSFSESSENGYQDSNNKKEPAHLLKFPEVIWPEMVGDNEISDSEDDPIQNSEIKPSAKRKLAPDYLFIFDDLSEEIRGSTAIASLLKTNRHYKSKVIICSQYLNDLRPDAIGNLDYILMFKKIPVKKLEEAHSKLNLDTPFLLFKTMYDEATSDPHSFLYVDIRKDMYRKNFNEEFDEVDF